MQKIVFLICLFLSMHANAYIAHKELPEQVLHFISDIQINKDGSLDIIERVTVHANQTQIKNGLTRFLPLQEESQRYFSALRYQLYDVMMDNKKLPFSIKRENKRFIIHIGDPKKLLEPGDYTYTIQYHVENAVDFLQNEDQLFWNVTGNDWNFPILSAEANITLPSDIAITHYMGYTGNQNDHYPFLKVMLPEKNKISFITTQPLIIHRGLTVLIAWPKGFLTPTPWYNQAKMILLNNDKILLTLSATAGLFIICALALRCKRRRNLSVRRHQTEILMKN